MLFYYNKNQLRFEKVKPKVYLFIVLSLVFMFLLSWKPNSYSSVEHNPTKNIYFTENALIKLLKDCNIKYPYIVLAQAKLESAGFTSEIFKNNNNMFGMRKAYQRITTAQSERMTYAYYKDWRESVFDYAMYQSEVMGSVSNENEYYAKLGKRYAEDPQYVSKLKHIVKEEKLKDIFKD